MPNWVWHELIVENDESNEFISNFMTKHDGLVTEATGQGPLSAQNIIRFANPWRPLVTTEELLDLTPPRANVTCLIVDSGSMFVKVIHISMPDLILCVPKEEIIQEETGTEAWNLAKELGHTAALKELYDQD